MITVEVGVFLKELIPLGPVDGSSSTLNSPLKGILDSPLMLEEDSCDERRMDDGFLSNVRQHKASSPISDFHLIFLEFVSVC